MVKSGDPVEQEKQLKYASLVANAVMLSNVADLTTVIGGMARDGHPVTPALVASTSPYMRRHILRFGPVRTRHGRPARTAQPAAVAVRVSLAIARRRWVTRRPAWHLHWRCYGSTPLRRALPA